MTDEVRYELPIHDIDDIERPIERTPRQQQPAQQDLNETANSFVQYNGSSLLSDVEDLTVG